MFRYNITYSPCYCNVKDYKFKISGLRRQSARLPTPFLVLAIRLDKPVIALIPTGMCEEWYELTLTE